MSTYQFTVAVLGGVPGRYEPFIELQQATELARANSLQDNRAYGIWNAGDALLVVVVDGEIFERRPTGARRGESRLPIDNAG